MALKGFMVELYDVEGDYMTGRAVEARSSQDAAAQMMQKAKRHGAAYMIVKKGASAWRYTLDGGVADGHTR